MLKMDFKKFKKVASDDHSTTMRSKDGHEIRIAHKALSKEMKNQLDKLPVHEEKPKKMAEGGEAEAPKQIPGGPGSPAIDPKAAKEVEKGATKSGFQPKEWIKNIKEGLGMAEGGDVPANKKADLLDQLSGVKEQILNHLDDLHQQIKDADVVQTARLQEKLNPNMVGQQMPPQILPAEQQMAQNAVSAVSGATLPFHEQAALDKASQVINQLQGQQPMTAQLANNIAQGVQPAQQRMAEIAEFLKQKALNKIPKKYAEGSKDGPVEAEEVGPQPAEQDVGPQPSPSSEQLQQEINALGAQPQDMGPQPQLAQPMSMLSNMQQPPAQPQEAQQQPQQPAMDVPNAGEAYMNQVAGTQAEANAMGELGRRQAAMHEQAAAQAMALKSQYDKNYADLDAERRKIMTDYENQHIDPEKYWDNHSKLLSGLGIILAGFNPSGRPNAALDFINHQIDRSLQAQMQNMNKEHNLLRASMEQFGNMNAAMQFSKGIMADYAAHKLDSIASKMADPLAQARAQKAIGAIQGQYAPMFMNLALMKTMSDINSPQQSAQQTAAGQQPQMNQASSQADKMEKILPQLRLLNPKMAEEIEKRLVPGVGVASIPVSESVRSQIVAKQQLDKAVRDLYDFAKQNSGTLLDRATVNKGKAMAATVAALYRQATNGGVYKAGEQEFIDKLVAPDPTQYLGDQRTLPQLEAIHKENADSANILHKSYGLPQSEYQGLRNYTFSQYPGAEFIKLPNGSYKRVK